MDEQALVNTLRRAEDAAQLHDATPALWRPNKHKKHFKHWLNKSTHFRITSPGSLTKAENERKGTSLKSLSDYGAASGSGKTN